MARVGSTSLMSVADGAIDLERTLRERFGLEQFRPGQRAVIESVIGGRDVLCVMPTGGGKSLCYQLPALLLPGLTLVVSPLVALMQDQVQHLAQFNIPAAFLNHTVQHREYTEVMEDVRQGRIKILYLAPETLVR